jgi:hypothetical protein
MNFVRRPTWRRPYWLAALALSVTAQAAEIWDAPAFSTPAAQL